MSDMPRVVIPLRSFDAGKSRLSEVLDVAARQALIEAMLTDVLSAVEGSGVSDVVIAACGEHAMTLANRLGVASVADGATGGGLNAALTRVLATGKDATRPVMIVAADLPRASASDLLAVMGSDAPVVLAPTHDAGTAVLLQRSPTAIPLAYGPASATKHAALATTAGIGVVTVNRDGLLYDLDTPADLFTAFLDATNTAATVPLGSHTRRVLQAIPQAALNAATLPPQT